jgi:hypothetical protein
MPSYSLVQQILTPRSSSLGTGLASAAHRDPVEPSRHFGPCGIDGGSARSNHRNDTSLDSLRFPSSAYVEEDDFLPARVRQRDTC